MRRKIETLLDELTEKYRKSMQVPNDIEINLFKEIAKLLFAATFGVAALWALYVGGVILGSVILGSLL